MDLAQRYSDLVRHLHELRHERRHRLVDEIVEVVVRLLIGQVKTEPLLDLGERHVRVGVDGEVLDTGVHLPCVAKHACDDTRRQTDRDQGNQPRGTFQNAAAG